MDIFDAVWKRALIAVTSKKMKIPTSAIPHYFLFFIPPPFEEWYRGIKCYPCPCVRSFVRRLSKFGVRSITFERLHRFNSNLVCWYIISKHRSGSIWVTIHWFLTELWAFYKNIVNALSGGIGVLWTHF